MIIHLISMGLKQYVETWDISQDTKYIIFSEDNRLGSDSFLKCPPQIIEILTRVDDLTLLHREAIIKNF